MKRIIFFLLIFVFAKSGFTQGVKMDSVKYPKPVTLSTQQDHEHMMKQLGIKSLRPGPSGNESAPNHANYDESVANPCPQLPDVLTLKNGKKVTSADSLVETSADRNLLEDFEREMYGRLPEDTSESNTGL